MEKLLVRVGQQRGSCTFRLHPKTRAKFKEELTGDQKFESVYVSYDHTQNPEPLVGSMSQQIITLLTGLSEPAIEKLGGFAFVEPVTGKELFKNKKANE